MDCIKKGHVFAIMVVFLAFIGCAGNRAQTAPSGRVSPALRQAKHFQPPGRGAQDPGAAGLYRPASFNGIFQYLRARKVGDLVTVNIVETSKASKKATTSSSRDSSITAGITNLLGYETKMQKSLLPGKYKFPDAFNNKVMFKASMENAFDGSGSTTRDETMSASITAKVIETYPNGNLLIEGTRQVQVNNETQFITLTGIIRSSDISPDNTVLSSYIADAKITYTGSGAVSDKQRPGWLMRIIDYVWPF